MKKVIKYFIVFLVITSILYTPLIALVWTIIFIRLEIYQKKKKYKYNEHQKLNFQINKFIKMMGMFSATNDYNILLSMEETIKYIDNPLKKNIEKVIMDLKMNYDFEKAFIYLIKEYKENYIFINFISNLTIIKKQSNIEDTASIMFEMASSQMQKKILFMNKIHNIKESHLKNFKLNLALGYLVIMIIVINMFPYYFDYARSLVGLLINNMILISLYFGYGYLLKKVYQKGRYSNG